MSDFEFDPKNPDNNPAFGPLPSRTWLAQRQRRLIADAERNELERARQDQENFLVDLARVAETKLVAMRATACGGEIAKLDRCTDPNASACEQRGEPSCPRSILAFDAKIAKEELLKRLVDDSGIPRSHLATIRAGMKVTAATLAVDRWIASSSRLLLLAGGVGVGKSVAGAHAIRRTPGRWLSCSDVGRVSRFEHAHEYRLLRFTPLLVIDDLGREYADRSGWVIATASNLIIDRYEDGLRTLLTSNLSPEQWQDYADIRLTDRIEGDGEVELIAGESFRRRKALDA